MNVSDVFIIIRETGMPWIFYRTLYMVKLKALNKFPMLERVFEKRADIRRIDIFDVESEKIECFLQKLSDADKHTIIERADWALEGKIVAFSRTVFDYGNPIDWQKNPVNGASIDKCRKWFSIADFEGETGDIKGIWEISRFSHVFFLLRAYMLTKEKKYYDGFINQVKSWIDGNPYSYGANYKCGQECALRIMNVLAAYGVFNQYGVIKDEDRKLLIDFVDLNYRRIMSNFFYAHKCVKIDHLISELCGMIICAWCSEDEKKVKKYFGMLNKQILEQFNEMGMYVSYSLNYQRYVMQLAAYVIKIQNKLGMSFDKRAKERLERAAKFLNRIMGDSGKVPNYGANDGTLIFPVTVCDFSDFRPVVNTILGLIRDETYYEPGNYSEEYLWFTNKPSEPLKAVGNSAKMQNIDGSGFWLLENTRIKIILNAHKYERRPGHMDQLHLDLWLDGKNVFCDTGTYSYALELGEHLRGNEGHNVVCVKNAEQMKRIGHFLNFAQPAVKILRRSEKDISCVADFKTGYSHERSVMIDDENIIITDVVKGRAVKDGYSILFHTSYDVQMDNGKVNVFNDEEILVCTLQSVDGEVIIEKEYASSSYLDKHEINKIRVKCKKDQNITVIEVKK